MIGLIDALRVWGGVIEADLQAEYAVSLWHLAASGQWRRIDRLISELSEDSRYLTQLAATLPDPPKRAGVTPDIELWGRTDRLLASVIDELAVANWQRAGGKAKKPPLLTSRKRRRGRNDLSHFDQVDIRAALAARAPAGRF
jgi:hypothetical protein